MTPVRPPKTNGDQEAERPQHRGLEGDGPAPHGADPVEDLHTGRHRDQHRHEGEERQQHRAGDVHVVRPHRDGQGGDRDRRVDQGLVAEDRLAAEDREDLGDDAEERQRDDVDLGVAEEPEQVLPEDDAAVGRDRRCAHRSTRSAPAARSAAASTGKAIRTRMRGDQGVPGEDRHAPHRHARGAHRDDRGDEVDGTEDRAEAGEAEAEDPEVTADAGRERRRSTAAGRRTSRTTAAPCGVRKPATAIRRAEEEEPEGEGVQTRERDVGRTDLQRHDHVGEAGEQRRREHQQHDRAVHREQLVVLLLGLQDLQAGLEQLGADDAAPSRRRCRRR